jgi:hypothetical protein
MQQMEELLLSGQEGEGKVDASLLWRRSTAVPPCNPAVGGAGCSGMCATCAGGSPGSRWDAARGGWDVAPTLPYPAPLRECCLGQATPEVCGPPYAAAGPPAAGLDAGRAVHEAAAEGQQRAAERTLPVLLEEKHDGGGAALVARVEAQVGCSHTSVPGLARRPASVHEYHADPPWRCGPALLQKASAA